MYQVYMFKDREISRDFVKRCKEKRFAALCLTVDTPVAGNRERDLVTGFGVPPKFNLRSLLSYVRHFPWSIRAIVKPGFDIVNVINSAGASTEIGDGVMEYVNSQFDRSITWKDVEWLAELWDGPLVVKGIQTVADAQKAVDDLQAIGYVFGHAGDGNLHVVMAGDPADEREWSILEDINQRIVTRAVELGGTCTGEHGVGIGKRKFMELEHGAAYQLMRRIKELIDPKGLMNPDKIFI